MASSVLSAYVAKTVVRSLRLYLLAIAGIKFIVSNLFSQALGVN
jgi:hypothetical protein